MPATEAQLVPLAERALTGVEGLPPASFSAAGPANRTQKPLLVLSPFRLPLSLI